MGDFIIQQIRGMLWFFDNIIYGLIDDVYGILLQITRTTLFDQEIINSFATRIYAFIGIFMLFKVSISFLTYVLNPDSLTDKEKGFATVFKRIILSLVMVVLVPYIFSEAYNLQSIILEENTIMNVIFGSPSDREVKIAGSNSTYAESAGQKIQFTVLFAFAQPNYDEFYQDNKYDLSSCKSVYSMDQNGNYQFRKTPSFDNSSSKDSSFIYALNETCFGVYNPDTDTYEMSGNKGTLYKAFDDNDLEKIYQNYAQGISQQSFDLFFRKDAILARDSNSGRYLINYKGGISTAVGIGVLYLFLMFCIDIAIRSIKLGFLQMIAPIPILSYCDPKSGKDGMFSKWFKMCKNTYLDLFVRLAALYLGIYIISLVGTFKDMVTGESVSNWLVNVFMIIGVLIFIKKLPDILKESLGLDGGSFKDFKFNPLKRIESDALGGKAIAAVGNKAVNTVGGIGAGALAMGAGVLTGQGLRLSALGKGIAGGFKGDKFGKNFSSSYGAARARKKELQEMEEDGVKRSDVFKEKLYNITHGGKTRAESVKTLQEQAKGIQSAYDRIKNQATACDSQENTEVWDEASRRWVRSESAKSIDKRLAELKKVQINRADFTGATAEADFEAALEAQKKRIKDEETKLEERINALAEGRVRYTDSHGAVYSGTGVASADKVISDTVDSIKALKKSSNELGKSLDASFVEITNNDVVGIMKQAKGTVAQTESGRMSDLTDIGKYAGGKKN